MQTEIDKIPEQFHSSNAARDVDGHDFALLVKDGTNIKDKFMLIADLSDFNLADGVSIANVVVKTVYNSTTRTIVFAITLAKAGSTIAMNNTMAISIIFASA